MNTLGRNVGGVAQLVTRFGNEIVDVVQDIHGAVANPFNVRGAEYVPAPMVYQAIRYGFRQLGNVAALANILRDPSKDRAESLSLQSVLNGIFGQLYVEQESSYAIPMRLTPNEFKADTKVLIVFVHGLCLNDSCWNTPAVNAFTHWAEHELNAEVAFLRYNTGQHISDNGRKLAGLLAHTPLPEQVILIGHSMGGLVSRSALYHGREQESPWVDKLSHLICLGSPHQGAVLERLGNYLNNFLAISSYTRPLMRLGNLRSEGIRDLRFGYLAEKQWRARAVDAKHPAPIVPLDSKVEHLFIAGTTSAVGTQHPKGDWLVDVSSGLAERYYPQATNLTRKLFYRMGHMLMIEEPRLYQYIQEWLVQTGAAGE